MIGKLEDSDGDTECILEFSGLSSMFKSDWRAHKSREGGSDQKAVKLFRKVINFFFQLHIIFDQKFYSGTLVFFPVYRSLTKKQVQDLYHYYKYDFLAFNYYYEDYMKAADTEDMTTTNEGTNEEKHLIETCFPNLW